MAKKKIGAPEEKTESRPKAVRPSAARKKPAAKKQKNNSPKGKYAEESTDHSSDYSTEDEDTVYEYTVVEYGGRRAQLIMGWRKAIMGPAPAASIDEASIDEAGPVEYLVKWRNESYHHCKHSWSGSKRS